MNQPYTDERMERALLSTIFIDNGALKDVSDLFRPDLFSNPDHRLIATTMLGLAQAGKRIDRHMVATRVAGKMPASYVATLVDEATVINARQYAETLESLWQGREARRVATDLLRLDPSTSGDQLVGQFSRRLAAIESKQVAEVKSLAEVMVDRLTTFQAIAADPDAQEYWATGFRLLDGMVGGFRKGEMFTIAARPGVGKTSFVTTVADGLASRGIPVCIFQLEDNADAVADRAILRRAKIGSSLLRDPGAWQKHHWDVVAAAVTKDVSLPVYVDDRHQRTMGDICAQMRKLARDKGVKVFVLDNLSEVLLDKADRGDERLDRALGRMSKQFRDTAQSVGAAAVLVVHLNRDIEKRGGDAKLSDIKNSGEVEDASHVVAVLSRQPESETLTVDIVKNRNGAKGKIDLRWNGPHMTVENW